MPTATTRKLSRASSSKAQKSTKNRAGTAAKARPKSSVRGKSTAVRKSTAAKSRGKTTRGSASSAKSRSRTTRSTAGRSRSSRSTSTRSRTASRPKSRAQSQGKTTIDHDEIRQWVESRGGTPATVIGTERDAEAAGLLRIDFPGYSGAESLSPIEWDEFFEKFDEANLAFLYDDKPASKFNKFVERKSRRF